MQAYFDRFPGVRGFIDRSLEEAAANLGATPVRVLREVTLPLMRSSLVSGAIFAFIVSFSDINIALFVSGVAAFTRTPVRNTAIARHTRGQTTALVATTGNGPVVAIFAAGGAVLALVGSLLGSLAAASRSSGVPFSDEFRLRRRESNGHHPPEAPGAPADVRRDETTILPPTH